MLKIKMIVVDRTRSPFMKEGESSYLKRLRKYVKVDWMEVKPVIASRGKSDEFVRSGESERILKRIKPQDYVISLDRRGALQASEELAAHFEAFYLSGKPLALIIGGPFGLADKVLKRSDKILSLSRLTFTHEMTRLILLEQLYRVFTIIHGEKYHK
jgi:23S rRNA (pseudouridine1915-N3)-methyltransferase